MHHDLALHCELNPSVFPDLTEVHAVGAASLLFLCVSLLIGCSAPLCHMSSCWWCPPAAGGDRPSYYIGGATSRRCRLRVSRSAISQCFPPRGKSLPSRARRGEPCGGASFIRPGCLQAATDACTHNTRASLPIRAHVQSCPSHLLHYPSFFSPLRQASIPLQA